MNIKLDRSIVGAAGVFYVSAELSKRGWVAMPTIRNTSGIDIIASKGNNSVKIQVKTNSYGNISYPMNKSGEQLIAKDVYYVFVTLKGIQERPDYYIIPSKLVANYIKQTHEYWVDMKPIRKLSGKENMTEEERRVKRRKSSMRQFPNYVAKFIPDFMNFNIEDYQDNWEILETDKVAL